MGGFEITGNQTVDSISVSNLGVPINQILKRSLGRLLTYKKMQVGQCFSPISDQVWRIVHHFHDLLNLSTGEVK